MNVFLNSFSNSGKLTSFNSLPHWRLIISCFAFEPKAQNNVTFNMIDCMGIHSFCSLIHQVFQIFVICAVNIYRNLLLPHSWVDFFKSVSRSDKIGMFYLLLSVLSLVVVWFCPDCSDMFRLVFISDISFGCWWLCHVID